MQGKRADKAKKLIRELIQEETDGKSHKSNVDTKQCTEYVLQVIMDKKDLKVIDQVIQKDYKNLQGVQLFWTALPEILKVINS